MTRRRAIDERIQFPQILERANGKGPLRFNESAAQDARPFPSFLTKCILGIESKRTKIGHSHINNHNLTHPLPQPGLNQQWNIHHNAPTTRPPTLQNSSDNLPSNPRMNDRVQPPPLILILEHYISDGSSIQRNPIGKEDPITSEMRQEEIVA